jgi:hypothetical protein
MGRNQFELEPYRTAWFDVAMRSPGSDCFLAALCREPQLMCGLLRNQLLPANESQFALL